MDDKHYSDTMRDCLGNDKLSLEVEKADRKIIKVRRIISKTAMHCTVNLRRSCERFEKEGLPRNDLLKFVFLVEKKAFTHLSVCYIYIRLLRTFLKVSLYETNV